MSSNLQRRECSVFLLGLAVLLANSVLVHKVGAAADSTDPEQTGCNDLSCKGKDDITESSKDIFLDVINSNPSLEKEQIVFSSEKDKTEDINSDEPSSGDNPSVSEPISSGGANSVEAVSSLETNNADGTSKPQDLYQSDAQEDPDSPSLHVIGMNSDVRSHPSKPESETDSAKHKLFPFLYTSLFSTFKNLVRSLMSEFIEDGGQQDGAANISEWNNQSSLIADEETSNDMNTTLNSTDPVKKTRFQCALKNISATDIGKVKVVNSTELLDILSLSKSQKSSACVLVMFYAPWCHFCAQTAPQYNALARAFPQLDILAVDTSHFSYLNARFGTVAVPNIMLFHSRSAVRFNHTHRVLDKFTQFVTNNTGLEPRRFVLLEPLDFVGPLPCIVKRNRDWLLWLAWVFVATCSAFGFVQSQYGQSFIARLKFLWQEHQHID
ncbi:hypothetical protein EGW08_013651 [Elysia chlorotica]|uniref:Thioredoxin domain-containing protein n=1 Tax=Elysia chlorotica TaxID=188477 RepID=A0A433TAF8_ELYCH|nr:hypothetical protein EGW08_013651 [Elysia chlorotica]